MDTENAEPSTESTANLTTTSQPYIPTIPTDQPRFLYQLRQVRNESSSSFDFSRRLSSIICGSSNFFFYF
jgi:hypothetical protein